MLLFPFETVPWCLKIQLTAVRIGWQRVTGNATTALSGNVNSSVLEGKSVNCGFAFYGGSRGSGMCSRVAARNTAARCSHLSPLSYVNTFVRCYRRWPGSFGPVSITRLMVIARSRDTPWPVAAFVSRAYVRDSDLYAPTCSPWSETRVFYPGPTSPQLIFILLNNVHSIRRACHAIASLSNVFRFRVTVRLYHPFMTIVHLDSLERISKCCELF